MKTILHLKQENLLNSKFTKTNRKEKHSMIIIYPHTVTSTQIVCLFHLEHSLHNFCDAVYSLVSIFVFYPHNVSVSSY